MAIKFDEFSLFAFEKCLPDDLAMVPNIPSQSFLTFNNRSIDTVIAFVEWNL